MRSRPAARRRPALLGLRRPQTGARADHLRHPPAASSSTCSQPTIGHGSPPRREGPHNDSDVRRLMPVYRPGIAAYPPGWLDAYAERGDVLTGTGHPQPTARRVTSERRGRSRQPVVRTHPETAACVGADPPARAWVPASSPDPATAVSSGCCGGAPAPSRSCRPWPALLPGAPPGHLLWTNSRSTTAYRRRRSRGTNPDGKRPARLGCPAVKERR
jgi:hypothetical protein